MSAFSWGPTGHRTVGEIAERNLTVIAKKKIKAILGKESLAKASTWPDEIKSDPDNYRYTFDWHYMSWPNDMGQYKPGQGGKLIWAIDEQMKVLKNKKSRKEKKIFALRFLVHLIGDIHQPLHVGNGKDRGGNDCHVEFHGEETNLHRLWDEGMINFTRLSYTELADFISHYSAREIRYFMKGHPLDWALESKEIRNDVYPTPVENRPYCSRENKPEELPNLGYPYSYSFYKKIERRLFQAGVRLAHLLNTNL